MTCTDATNNMQTDGTTIEKETNSGYLEQTTAEKNETRNENYKRIKAG